MARAATKTASIDTSPPPVGHNGLTDKQHDVLFFYHYRERAIALAAKKAADARLKVVDKVIKAELGPEGGAELKAYDQAQTAEGLAKINAEIAAKTRGARLAGAPIGHQFDLLQTDRTPLDERAFAQGRTAALKGESLVNPYNEATLEGGEFASGWREGQDDMLAEMQKRMEAKAEAEKAELIEGAGHDNGGDLDEEQD